MSFSTEYIWFVDVNDFMFTNPHRFLYELLKQRTPEQSISHKEMPTYADHIKFVLGDPYKFWYIIMNHEFPVGSIYLTGKHEIGIHILDGARNKGFGSAALTYFIQQNKIRYNIRGFTANINPKNISSIKFFEKHGFERSGETWDNNKIIQYIYILSL